MQFLGFHCSNASYAGEIGSATNIAGEWKNGLQHRQVTLDKGGLAHSAVSNEEKLELGDLSL